MTTTRTHVLTVFKRDFKEIKKGNKKCELRPDDAYGFGVGDILHIEETENGFLTGRYIDVEVTHITSFRADCRNWALMSFKKVGKR